MRALKVLVIVMALLILAGLAVVAITVAKRAGTPGDKAAGAPAPPSPPIAGLPAAPAAAFGETLVRVPPGFTVAETRQDGDRLLIRLQAADGRGRIVLVDLRSGRIGGTVLLEPEGAGAPATAPAR